MSSHKPLSYKSSNIRRATHINVLESARLLQTLRYIEKAKVHQCRLTNREIRLTLMSINNIRSSSGYSLGDNYSDHDHRLNKTNGKAGLDFGANADAKKGPCFMYGERIWSRRRKRLQRSASAFEQGTSELEFSNSVAKCKLLFGLSSGQAKHRSLIVPTLSEPKYRPLSVPTLSELKYRPLSVPTLSEPKHRPLSVPTLSEPKHRPLSVPTLSEPKHRPLSVPTLSEPKHRPLSVPTLSEPKHRPLSVPTLSEPKHRSLIVSMLSEEKHRQQNASTLNKAKHRPLIVSTLNEENHTPISVSTLNEEKQRPLSVSTLSEEKHRRQSVSTLNDSKHRPLSAYQFRTSLLRDRKHDLAEKSYSDQYLAGKNGASAPRSRVPQRQVWEEDVSEVTKKIISSQSSKHKSVYESSVEVMSSETSRAVRGLLRQIRIAMTSVV